MPILYIPCGIPGSGKTTWCNQFIQNNDVRYVSRDEIRFSLVNENEPYFAHEKIVFKKFIGIIAQTLADGFDVIADATNLNRFSRSKLTQAIDEYITDYEIVYVVFNTNIDVCIERNEKRTGRTKVPTDVIYNMFNNFVSPNKFEDKRVKEIIEVDE